ncbi:hypothetical protein [Actinacidiphila sp. ITFR-21]|uniref:hypothetical protein n=1 Tax=Actinacidiphila sp. ITFR-21 TaxID=3075199 RepID=UPI00288AD070|nr:hypothetical protein [Streptomyces sp. ITFR-21]WNI15676.1 hypothetical protein RLT57_09130 [Streptomyces sp. ITFR-21]
MARSSATSTDAYGSPVAFSMPSSHIRFADWYTSYPRAATSSASRRVAAAVSCACAVPRLAHAGW